VSEPPRPASDRALVLAPFGRDAAVAAAILREAGIENAICEDVPCLMRDLRAGAALAIIVEEALHDQDYSELAHWVDAQPAWSDFPIIVLARRGGDIERNPAAGRFIQTLGNVTFLERPFHPTTLVSVAQTAMRGRRRQYEARERLEELRAAEERFRTIAENIPTLCWMADPEGHVVWFNSRWYEYTGTTPEDQDSQTWDRVHDPDVLPEVRERWRHSIETGEPFEMTFPLRGADGVFRPFLTQVVPLRDGQGNIVRWFGTNTNVIREHRDRERLRLMVNELNHRVKNTLATIQAIATLTLRSDGSPDQLRESLTARILALSKAHDVLTDTQWSGADLREIAARAGVPYESTDQLHPRLRIDGPTVRLPPRTAIAVALALHELATNAAKYGALCVADGHVELNWGFVSMDGGRVLRIVWREIGGPPVKPPKRAGFGSRMIQRGLAADLNGRVEVDYRPEGVVCTIEARIDPLEDGIEFDPFLNGEVRSFTDRVERNDPPTARPS
jgi:PAS domain S-box-containing protein